MTRRHHVLPFGAEPVEGGTRFRLWAPRASAVTLCIEADDRKIPLGAEKDGWFAVTTEHARPGTQYRYLVEGLKVPDPAARWQPGDVHGASEVIDPGAYEWHDDGWRGQPWEEIVLYELHTGTFSATGDFAGVQHHLDHLAELGVTAIELLPVADFPGRWNWGYDGVLLFAPDATYGRPEDLKRLVEACHARGLSIFLDVVYNHFGPDGNYLHHYAPAFFTERHQTPWGAAINYDGENARAVREFYVHNALYWLEEFHMDGLRLDAVHAILDDSRPDILTDIAASVRGREWNRPIHLVLENDKNQASYLRRDGKRPRLYTAQWNDDIHHVTRVLTTGDASGYYADYAGSPAEKLGRALTEGFVYQGEASLYRDGKKRGEPSAELPPTAFIAFIQNHDQVGNNAFGARLSKLAKPEAIRVAAATYLLAPQVPMLFMGEEWAAEQPFAFFCDFGAELAAAVRDGRRQEFAKFPEFQDEGARERIPDPGAESTFKSSVLDWSAAERPVHAESLALYSDLIAVRAREIVPRLARIGGHAGTFRALAEKAVLASWRLDDGGTLSLAINFGTAPAPLDDALGRLLHSVGSPPCDGALSPLSLALFAAG
jgi:malto-oligosyltrehalose trehalohydrolase